MQLRHTVSVLLICMGLLSATCQAAGAKPELVCENTRCDLGEAPASATFEHQFILLNDGRATLRLSSLKTTHKAIIAKLSRLQVEPGGSATVNVTGPMSIFVNEPRQAITINTSDVDQPTVRLQLFGKIAAAATTAPATTVAVVHAIIPQPATRETKPEAPSPAKQVAPAAPADQMALIAERICAGDEGAP